MADQLRFVLDSLPHLLIGFPDQRPGGLLLSVLLAAAAVIAGFVLGNGIALSQRSRLAAVRWLGRRYVDLFRGVPLVLLLLLTYQLFGRFRWVHDIGPHQAALIALTLYSSAYQAEILRAGLQSVPDQLTASARVMGGSPWQAYRKIELRYAVRVMLPALAGQAISLFKDTSVVLIIGVADIMMVARVTLGSDVTSAPYWVALYLSVGLLYFCVAFALSRIARHWERQAEHGDLVHALPNY